MEDLSPIRESIPKDTIQKDTIKRDFSLTKEGVSMKLYGEHPAFYDKVRDKFVEKVTYIVITYWHILALGIIALFFFIATVLGKRFVGGNSQLPSEDTIEDNIVAP